MPIRSITGSATTTVERNGEEVDVEYYFTYYAPTSPTYDDPGDPGYVVITEYDGAAIPLTEDEISELELYHFENPPLCYVPEFDERPNYAEDEKDFEL